MSNSNNVPEVNISGQDSAYKWSSLGVHPYVKLAIIAGLFACLFWVDITTIVNRWFDDFGTWGHGLIIPLFSLYFVNQRKQEILIAKKKPSYLGFVALLFLIGLYIYNVTALKFAYGQPLIMIACIGAIVLFLGGWKMVKYLWLPVAYLVFAVPLPRRIHNEITFPLRELASKVAATLLSLLPDVEATSQSVVIDIVYKGQQFEPSLNVADACSGMKLLMTFVALGVAMAYLHYRPTWQRIVLLISTVPIAIVCNLTRVTITGIIYILIDPEYAQGIYHDALGMLMLLLAFNLYGGLAWFMNSLFVAEDDQQPQEEIIIRRKDK